MKANPNLKKFLSPYDQSIQKLTMELRNFIVELVPEANELIWDNYNACLLYTSPSPRDATLSRMPSSA